jgi:hypothetical protein
MLAEHAAYCVDDARCVGQCPDLLDEFERATADRVDPRASERTLTDRRCALAPLGDSTLATSGG